MLCPSQLLQRLNREDHDVFDKVLIELPVTRCGEGLQCTSYSMSSSERSQKRTIKSMLGKTQGYLMTRAIRSNTLPLTQSWPRPKLGNAGEAPWGSFLGLADFSRTGF